MKFILSVTAILFLFAQFGYAQTNPPFLWRVGWYGEIDFSSINGIPYISSDTFPTEFTNAGAWDSIGNMVIHTNGIAVFNSNMDTMPGGTLEFNSTLTLPQYGSNLTQGTIILPRPGFDKQYYLFHKAYQISGATGQIYWGKLYSSVIDLNLNNGLGIITPVKNIEIEDSLWVGYINAVRHGNGRDWWLVSGRNYSNVINTWLVQSDTIIGPFSQPVGLPITWPQALNQTQFSPDGSKLAIAYFEFSGNVYQFMLADFDRCTGLLSNLNTYNIPNDGSGNGVSGVEFSESGRYLYASSAFNLYQFDLWSSNIQNSRLHVKLHDNFPSPFPSGFSSPKRGPDGKIYFATGNGNYGIDIVNYPDSLGVACNVQLRQINYFAQFGATYAMNILVMPNYPDYTLGPLVGSPCDTITGVSEFHSDDSGISIYPNPAIGSFSVQLPTGANGKVSIELLDYFGRKVYSQEFNERTMTQIISLPETVATGVYVCRIITEQKVYSEKVVVKR
jgi:hypothetical protein